MPTSRRRSIALIAVCIAAACEAGVAGPSDPGTDAHGPISVVTPVEFVTVSIEDAALNSGRLTHVDAVTLDANHQTLTDRTVTWTASDTTVVSVVTVTGTRAAVRALAGGTSTLTATCEGRSASVTVTVYTPSVANVLTALAASAIPVGQTTRASAFPVDSLGNPLTGKTVTWSSLNPDVATVSSAGIVSGVASGSAVIRATVDAKVGDATLVVSASTTAPAPAPSPSPSPSLVQPVDTDSVFVSSPRTWVNAAAPSALVQTPYHASWTATIPGATWIWRTAVVANPMAIEVDTFTRRFVPKVSPGAVTLDVASDNGFRAFVNGTLVVDRLLDTGPTYSTVSHYAVPVSALVAGTNTLTIIVQNNANPFSSDPAQNSAGLLYRLAISTALPISTASVTVRLDSSSLGTGHTSNATAVAKDASGATLSGKTPLWASQNTSIATVNATTGVVTGVSAGSTQIQATIDGIVGSAPLTVTVPSVITAPAPAPGPGTGTGPHPNEPAGFSQLAAQPFDAVENSDFYPSGAGNPTIVTDATNPGSSANVAQMLFPAGFVSGSAPGSEWVKRFFSTQTVYVSFLIKLSNNWWGNEGAGANKVLYWEEIPPNSGYSAAIGSIEVFGIGSGNLVPGIACNVSAFVPGPDNPNGAAPTVKLDPNVASPLVTRGGWHRYEVLLTMNTPGNTDGGVKWWLDGTLVGDYSNRMQFNNVGAPFSDVFWSPTYGGGGPAVPADQWMWLKDLYVSGR